MGFESARAARRRLAVLAMSNEQVLDALAPSSFPGLLHTERHENSERMEHVEPASDLAHHLDELAHDIVATPGAGGALLVAFAAQARALGLVMEAARRTSDTALPPDVLSAVQSALRVPVAISELGLG